MSENRERGTQADPNGNLDDTEQAKLKWGRGVSVVGIALALVGVVVALLGSGASIVPGALGIGLGILGYFLGANRLGTATIVVCTAALFFGLAASQGLIPGIGQSDRGLPPVEPRAEDN